MEQNAPLSGHILILDSDPVVCRQAASSIAIDLPQAQIVTVGTAQEFRNVVAGTDFDLVIIDCDLTDSDAIQLIHEVRLKDYEPAVMVVSSAEDPRIVARIFNVGCQRYIVKHGEWLSELGPAIRHTLRMKRLEEENRRLLGRLTEANLMLEEKNKRLDEFSATVAHDIRGMIGGLSMRLEYILDGSKELEPKFHRLLTGAYDTSTRLTEIVQATYDFARLGAESVKKSAVDLDRVVQEVVRDMSFDDSLDINIGISELPMVWGNETLLRRVFLNLISNAVRYNDKDKKIINIGVKRQYESTFGRMVQIAVDDNGRGIEEGVLNRIFEMFWQGRPHQEKGEGLGIGLAVVRRIVELHGGRVQVNSVPGAGATFLIDLPLDAPLGL